MTAFPISSEWFRKRSFGVAAEFLSFVSQLDINSITTFMTERIGFVGIGRMGSNMARRLKDCGFSVTTVYDVRPEAAQALAKELGCEAASTLARVTDQS